MFLKIPHNSQENTCPRVPLLIKLQAWSWTQVFSCEFCENFKYIIFTEDLLWMLLFLLCAWYTWNLVIASKLTFFHSSGERTTPTYVSNFLIYICLLFIFMFTFSFKFLQTSLTIKELIKHENKFNRKVLQVFHEIFERNVSQCILAFKKYCYENMQQIYRRTAMPKCHFNKK